MAPPQPPPPLPPLPPELGEQLHRALVAMPGNRYAVLDGVRDPELRARLEGARLTARPLYLENRSSIDIWAGPVLVAITERTDLDRFVAAVPTGQHALFWGWPADMATLHRHLRSINVAIIPEQEGDAAVEVDASDAPGAGDRVLFRHYDPEALAPIVPVLRPDQIARLLGDALAILFAAEDFGGLTALARPERLPPDPGGLLRLDADQMAAAEARRRVASHRRIGRFLRAEAPGVAGPMDDRALAAQVAIYEREATELGLSTERDVARWGYLQMLSNNGLYANPAVRDSFRPEVRRRPAGEYLDAVFDGIIAGLRQRG